MSSMFVQEAYALAELATIIDRPPALSAMLNKRGKSMAQLISAHLWNEDLGIFVNRFSSDHNNGSFYPHVSPTSFYALQAKAATDEQAARMAQTWLMNKSHFCIAPTGDYAGLDDTCYWGLPSIEASDPAYPKLGYWRGYIWGPQAQLTYWSLQNYDHVPAVRAGRKAMCKQLAGLMMSQWNEHRHICENYNPHKDAMSNNDKGDCSGTRFYHWGALTGAP
jgi:glycogen debranching enzyme